MSTDVVAQLFDRAYELREEKTDWQERNAATRDSLRNLAKAGVLTNEQLHELNEIYPERRRNGAVEED